MSDELEKRLSNMESDIKVIKSEMKGSIELLHSKLDGLMVSVDKLSNGIGQRVQEHGEQIFGLNRDVLNHTSYIEAVSKKIDKHENSPGHWKFLIILISVLSLIIGLTSVIIR